MIKISDLILGDIIQVKVNETVRISKITGLLNATSDEKLPDTVEVLYQSNDLMGSIPDTVCIPIELTEELLIDVFGFERCEDKPEFVSIEVKKNNQINYNYKDKKLVIYTDDSRILSIDGIEYLHQLQHHLYGFKFFDFNDKIQRLDYKEDKGYFLIKRKHYFRNRYKELVYLEETDEECKYLFVADYDYMSVSYHEHGYYSIDPSGGPYLSVGGTIPVKDVDGDYKNVEILKIEQINNKYYLITKENIFK